MIGRARLMRSMNGIAIGCLQPEGLQEKYFVGLASVRYHLARQVFDLRNLVLLAAAFSIQIRLRLHFLTEQWQGADCRLDFERMLLAQFQEETRTQEP
jgi:hypothetical protein